MMFTANILCYDYSYYIIYGIRLLEVYQVRQSSQKDTNNQTIEKDLMEIDTIPITNRKILYHLKNMPRNYFFPYTFINHEYINIMKYMYH